MRIPIFISPQTNTSSARSRAGLVALTLGLFATCLGVSSAQAHDKQWRQAHSLSKTELTFPSSGSMTPYYSPAALAPGMSIDIVEDCRDAGPDCQPTLRLSGTFTTTTALRALIESTLDQMEGQDVRRIVLDSQGGGVEAAMWLATVVEMAKVDTEVDDNGACVSACVYVLSAGHRRTVGKWAVVAVHQQNTTSSLIPEPIRAQGEPGIRRHLQALPDVPAPMALARMDYAADLIQRSTGWWVAQTLRTGVSPMIVTYATMASFPVTGGAITPLTHSCMVALGLDNQGGQNPASTAEITRQCDRNSSKNEQ